MTSIPQHHTLFIPSFPYSLLPNPSIPFFPHCKKNSIYVFLFWELRSLSPSVHIHVSVSGFYIPRMHPQYISPQQNRQNDLGNIKISHRYRSVGTGRTEHYNSVLEIRVSFLGIYKWEPDIILDSHRPFICSALPSITVQPCSPSSTPFFLHFYIFFANSRSTLFSTKHLTSQNI